VDPHLPDGVVPPARPVAVRALVADVGTVAGHRVVLLALEDWGAWADLRFARIALPGAPPLARRIPLAADWQVTADGAPLEVVDVAGRGDRGFSNGEVRLRPAPAPGSELVVRARFAPDAEVSVALRVP
jgi:hypothetical protein